MLAQKVIDFDEDGNPHSYVPNVALEGRVLHITVLLATS